MLAAASQSLTNGQFVHTGPTARGTAAVRSAVRTLRLWGARIRERHTFPVLDERDLRDLRVSRWDVERELAKPFWRD
jgi:uncharacterized protein YjiS (DUF1127 family)